MAKRKITKKVKTAIDIYNEMKEQVDVAIKSLIMKSTQKLTSYGKQYYIFPKIEQLGFDSYDKIMDEYRLIVDKKSTQSKSVRESIVNLVLIINERLES